MDKLSYLLGLGRRRLFEFFGSPRYSRRALHDMDRKLARHLGAAPGFFIEVGGNDGLTQSNTYYLEKIRGWHGVLVEAVPDLYHRCQKERRGSYVFNYALVEDHHSQPFVDVHFANLMSLVDGSFKTAQAQAEHIEAGLKVQNLESSYVVRVPTRTLESILDELPVAPVLDFLSLDVEGYELNVLKGLNLKKYRPRYILVEARFFEEVDGLLKDLYDRVEQLSPHDYLYKLKEA